MLGLQEGYHGDTLGAMDAVAPSPYNGRLQSPWFTGRGLFLDPPTAGVVDGTWTVALPAGGLGTGGAAAAAALEPPEQQLRFGNQEEVFDPARDGSPLAGDYRAAIQAAIEAHEVASPGVRLGACIMEPLLQVGPVAGRLVFNGWQAAGQPAPPPPPPLSSPPCCRLQGAGGMRLIDPLYQREVVRACR